jgi:hypothetical protein
MSPDIVVVLNLLGRGVWSEIVLGKSVNYQMRRIIGGN